MAEYWKLRITDESGRQYEACGMEETLRMTYDECKAAMNAADGTGGKTVEVHGMVDAIDRATLEVCLKASSIVALELWKHY